MEGESNGVSNWGLGNSVRPEAEQQSRNNGRGEMCLET